MPANQKLKILFLCTGNSCRSQMAEGLINARLGDHWLAQSAGTQPTGQVHPEAIAALREIGIDISKQRSKSIGEFAGQIFDVVITVCDDVAKNCPVWLGRGRRVHLGFPDPAAVPLDRQAAEFRTVRDATQTQILGYLKQWQSHSKGRNT